MGKLRVCVCMYVSAVYASKAHSNQLQQHKPYLFCSKSNRSQISRICVYYYWMSLRMALEETLAALVAKS